MLLSCKLIIITQAINCTNNKLIRFWIAHLMAVCHHSMHRPRFPPLLFVLYCFFMAFDTHSRNTVNDDCMYCHKI